MTLMVDLEESDAVKQVRRNRENYEAVVRKINHQLRLRSREKTDGQQITIWKLIYLFKEAIRLKVKLQNSDRSCSKNAVGLINGLEVFLSLDSSEQARHKAFKLALDICKFYCPEVVESEVESAKDL